MADMTKPRKKRHELSDITNPQQRAVAEIVRPVIEASGLTMKQFASLEPRQALTINNRMFNPDTNGVETPKSYRTLGIKLSKINPKMTAEEYYKELIEAAGLDYKKFPFNPSSEIVPQIAEDTVKSELMPVIVNLEIPCKMPKKHYFREPEVIEKDGYSQTRNFFHDLTCDYSSSDNAPIDYWALDFYTGVSGISPLQSFFYNILRDGTDKNVKYSFVTDSKVLFNKAVSMNVPALNLIVSAILFDGQKFTETYINTGVDHSEIDKAGLSL